MTSAFRDLIIRSGSSVSEIFKKKNDRTYNPFFLLCAIANGMVMSTTNGIAGQLVNNLDGNYFAGAGTIYFGASVFSCIVFLPPIVRLHSKHASEEDRLPLPGIKPYFIVGPFCGALKTAIMSYCVASIHLALIATGYTTGMMIMGCFVDQYGLFGYPKRGTNLGKVISIIIVLIGLALSMIEKGDSEAFQVNAFVLKVVALTIFSGTISPLQACGNRLTGHALPYRPQGTIVCLIGGGIILTLCAVIRYLLGYGSVDYSNVPVWQWLTPGLGATYVIFSEFSLTPLIGVVVFGVLQVMGNMCMSLFLDVTKVFDPNTRTLTIPNYIGVFLTIFGVWINIRASQKATLQILKTQRSNESLTEVATTLQMEKNDHTIETCKRRTISKESINNSWRLSSKEKAITLPNTDEINEDCIIPLKVESLIEGNQLNNKEDNDGIDHIMARTQL